MDLMAIVAGILTAIFVCTLWEIITGERKWSK